MTTTTRLLLTTLLLATAARAQPTSTLEGAVVEKLDAAGYSYVKVHTKSGDEWAAVPFVELAVGAQVTVEVQARMQQFESKTLKRTWPVIAFGTIAQPAKPEAAAPPQNPHLAGLPKEVVTPALEGDVKEKLDAGTYTYLRLSTKDGETWAAVPKADVAPGAHVHIKNPQPMDGFQSPTLKRTFERIVFGTLDRPAPK